MEAKILGSGPTELVIGRGKGERLQSSMLINNELLIDATPSIRKQLTSKDKIKGILITHAHVDAIMGLKYIQPYLAEIPTPVIAAEHTINWIRKRVGRKGYLSYFKLTPDSEFMWGGYKIKPIAIEHSVMQPKFDPTIAYKINNKMLYCSDIDYEYFYSERGKKIQDEIKTSKITILDGAMCRGNIRGHLNIFEAARYLGRNKCKNIIFTQIGHSCPNFETLEKDIQKYDSSYKIAYDGMAFRIGEEFSEYLRENKEGIVLEPSHAQMVWQGNKKLIIKGKLFQNAKGNLFDERCTIRGK